MNQTVAEFEWIQGFWPFLAKSLSNFQTRAKEKKKRKRAESLHSFKAFNHKSRLFVDIFSQTFHTISLLFEYIKLVFANVCSKKERANILRTNRPLNMQANIA